MHDDLQPPGFRIHKQIHSAKAFLGNAKTVQLEPHIFMDASAMVARLPQEQGRGGVAAYMGCTDTAIYTNRPMAQTLRTLHDN